MTFLKAVPVVFLGSHLALALAPPINFPVDKISFLFALEEHLLTRLKWLTKKGFQKLETVWQEIFMLLDQGRFNQALVEMGKVWLLMLVLMLLQMESCWWTLWCWNAVTSIVTLTLFQILKKNFWRDHLYDINYDGNFLKSNEYICFLQVCQLLSISIAQHFVLNHNICSK